MAGEVEASRLMTMCRIKPNCSMQGRRIQRQAKMELREDQADVCLCGLVLYVIHVSVCKSGFCLILIHEGGLHSA